MIETNVQLQTPRFLLSPVEHHHCNSVYLSWLKDKEVNRFMETKGEGMTEEDLKAFVDENKATGNLFLAIQTKDEGRHIGNVRVYNLEGQTGELGLMIGDKDYWEKGVAPEVSKAIFQYCKDQGLSQITGGINESHSKSLYVYEKMGFKVTEKIQVKNSQGITTSAFRIRLEL